MVIYLEYIFLLNFFVNLLIVMLSVDTLKGVACWWRMCISATIGAIYVCVLTKYNILHSIPIKIALSIVMVAIMTKHKSASRFVGMFCVFFAYTFLLGGVVQGVFNFGTNNNIYAINYDILPLFLALGMVVVYLIFRIVFTQRININREDNFIKKITICVGDNHYTCLAYWDSGNKLYYATTRPVMVVDNKVIQQLYKDRRLSDICDYVSVNTVTGKKEMPLYVFDKVIFEEEKNKKYYDVHAVLTDTKFNNYSALLNCDM